MTAIAQSKTADQKLHFLLSALLCFYPWCFLIGAAATDVVLSVIGGLFLIRSFTLQDTRWLQTTWIQVALALWAYLVVTNILMNGFAIGLKHSVPWVRFVLFAAALEHFVLSDAVWRQRLWWSLGAVIGFTVVDALVQGVFGSDLLGHTRIFTDRLSGPFSRHKLGIFLVKVSFPVLLFSMIFLKQQKKPLGTTLSLSLWAIFLLTIFLSGERMALLLTGLGGILAFCFLPQLRRFFLKMNAIMGLLLVILLLTVPSQRQRFLDRSLQEFDKPLESPYQTLTQSALQMTRDFPVFGVGIRQFRQVCLSSNYGPLDSKYPRCSTHPHNIYVEWLVETGVVGLLLFLSLIFVWGRRVVGSWSDLTRDPISAGLMVTLCLQLWPIGAAGSFFNNWNAGLFWFMLGLLMFYINKSEKRSI